jgi:hypothetical protein
MIYHATTLCILFVSVMYKLDKEWCPLSLDMTTFVVTLLVRMIHVWAHKHKLLLVFVCAVAIIDDDCCIEFFSAAYKNVWLGDIQGPRAISWTDSKKEISLAKGCRMKGNNRCVKNIWSNHRVRFLGQLRESLICSRYAAMKRWITSTGSTIPPWPTGEKTVCNILLRRSRTNIILICYIRLSSQDMSSKLGVRQGRSS